MGGLGIVNAITAVICAKFLSRVTAASKILAHSNCGLLSESNNYFGAQDIIMVI